MTPNPKVVATPNKSPKYVQGKGDRICFALCYSYGVVLPLGNELGPIDVRYQTVGHGKWTRGPKAFGHSDCSFIFVFGKKILVSFSPLAIVFRKRKIIKK